MISLVGFQALMPSGLAARLTDRPAHLSARLDLTLPYSYDEVQVQLYGGRHEHGRRCPSSTSSASWSRLHT